MLTAESFDGKLMLELLANKEVTLAMVVLEKLETLAL